MTILQFKFGSIEEKFYIYLIRKENKERFNQGHKLGEIYLTRGTIAKDLETSEGIARRLLKQFQELEIIKLIKSSPKTSKKPSLYMLTIYDTLEPKINQDDNQDDNQEKTKKNGLKSTVIEFKEPRNHQDDNQDDNQSIIDNIINNKNNNIVQNEFEQQCDLIWNTYPNKKGKAKAYKKLPKILKKYGYEQIKRCVERYSLEVKETDKQYIKHGDTFFNGAYLDYLDSNYIEIDKEQKREVNLETNEQIKKQAEKDLAAILGR